MEKWNFAEWLMYNKPELYFSLLDEYEAQKKKEE